MNHAVSDNPHCRRKVAQVRDFLRRRLADEESFVGAVITDSVAHGDARADSDVDMFLIFEPLDLAIVPGDFLYSPLTNDFFARGESLPADPELLHIDARRVDLARWREGHAGELERHLLAAGLLVYDRDGCCEAVVDEVARYPDDLRTARLIDGYYQTWYHLRPAKAFSWYERADGVSAHAHLTAGLAYFVQFLFAWHGRWMTWLNKQVPYLLSLPDPVGGLPETIAEALLIRDHSRSELERRIGALSTYMKRMEALLQSERILPAEHPQDWAYSQAHQEIGLRRTMDEWRLAHAKRRATTICADPERNMENG